MIDFENQEEVKKRIKQMIDDGMVTQISINQDVIDGPPTAEDYKSYVPNPFCEVTIVLRVPSKNF